jgi:2-polyprenyl-6-methoxyphenol hydroxylase-like FAD-dependent oxidoreductase
MSGLFAALLLRQRGYDVDVYERVEGELAGRGAGIVAQPEMRDVFERLGINPAQSFGVETQKRRTFDRDGRLIGESECQQVLTAWERVYRLLRDAFPPERYHRGMKLDHIEQDDAAVTAHFSNGTQEHADLLVGADGGRSTVRMQYLPEAAPLYAGYVAWRAMVDEAAISPATRADVFDYMAFTLPPGEQMLGYPVAGANDDLRRCHRRYNLVWYRPADEATKLPWMLTDASGHTHEGSIPPPLIRAEVIAEMRDAAARLLPPQLREVMLLPQQPFLQPIYDLETPHMAFGRVAIVGDAAFVARPHVGAGVAKAAEDSVALVDALAAEPDVPSALKRFEKERLGVGSRIVRRARQLGAYIQAERATPEERAYAERHFSPQAVMAETALMDFLYQR